MYNYTLNHTTLQKAYVSLTTEVDYSIALYYSYQKKII